MKPETLVVMALEAESQGLLEAAGYPVLYCGVGKVNAAQAIAWRLAEYGSKPLPLVLNCGTAGSPHHARHALVAPNQFIQRDMDATGLGFRFGQTPFDTLSDMLEFPVLFPALPSGICASGDSFLQGTPPLPCDVIDMEAYALAKICALRGAQFGSIKYITDGADEEAHLHWQDNLRHAAKAFVQAMERTV